MSNLSPIKSFSVYGLFGTHDVHIPFNENTKILVGENGLGKTQVLNIFYYTLTQNFFKLSEFKFDTIELILLTNPNHPIKIEKHHIDDAVRKLYQNPMIEDVIEDIGFTRFELLRKEWIQNKGSGKRLEEKILSSKMGKNYPSHHIFRIFEELERRNTKLTLGAYLDTCRQKINAVVSHFEVLYFPTFRRVEAELYKLGYDEDGLLGVEDSVIHFGMDDVSEKLRAIESKVNQLMTQELKGVISNIISQIVQGLPEESDNNCLENITESDIDFIFKMIGNDLPDTIKSAMRDIVVKKSYAESPKSLITLLEKLIKASEKQRDFDKLIKVFRDVCNHYLIEKEIFYNESEIKIFVKSNLTKNEIDLKYLSSGEKQIISMFSKVYLSERERFIVLFDEPELSLSMEWQKKLLPDIVESKKCDFLLAVTHSPFVFDNELDQYAVGLSEYIQPVAKYRG
jgi:predicted ATP-binding protein involved in virulence